MPDKCRLTYRLAQPPNCHSAESYTDCLTPIGETTSKKLRYFDRFGNPSYFSAKRETLITPPEYTHDPPEKDILELPERRRPHRRRLARAAVHTPRPVPRHRSRTNQNLDQREHRRQTGVLQNQPVVFRSFPLADTYPARFFPDRRRTFFKRYAAGRQIARFRPRSGFPVRRNPGSQYVLHRRRAYQRAGR